MYRAGIYYLCKNLAEMPFTVFLPIFFIAIAYYMIGLNPAVENFFICMGILVLVSNSAVSFGELSLLQDRIA